MTDPTMVSGRAAPPDPSDAAERFARAWDEVAGGSPVADVVASLAGDYEIASLVRLAAAASLRMPAVIPTPARARQRSELCALVGRGGDASVFTVPAAPRGQPRPNSTPGRRGAAWPRWMRPGPQWALRLTAALLAATLGLGSTVVASANDVPGDALYPVKRAAETARMALTFDPIRRAEYHLELASLRLSELREMVNRGRNPSASEVEALIALFWAAEAGAAAADDGALLVRLRAARAAAAGELREISDRLPPGPAGALAAAAGTLQPAVPPAPESSGERPSRPPFLPGATHTDDALLATPTATAEGAGVLGQRSAEGGLATAPATVVVPTVAVESPATAPAAPPSGGSERGGSPPADDPGQPGSAATAPPPPAVEPPASPAEAPTADNSVRDARATELAKNPPKPTRAPTPKRGR